MEIDHRTDDRPLHVREISFVGGQCAPMEDRSVFEDIGLAGSGPGIDQHVLGEFCALAHGKPVLVQMRIVTPEWAKAALELTEHNPGSFTPTHAKKFERSIQANRFGLAESAIVIDMSSNTTNGRHRLTAVVKANRPIVSLVVFGDLSVIPMDTGKRRSAGQILQHLGFSNGALRAATIRQLLMWTGATSSKGGSGYSSFGTDEIVAFAQDNPALTESIRQGMRLKNIAPVTVIASSHWMIKQRHPNRGSAFFSALEDPSALKTTDPVVSLRNLLRNYRERRDQVPSEPQIGSVIKAFNMWFDGVEIRNVKQIVWATVGPHREARPQIKSRDETG